jgi:hypothetical protein
MGHVKTLSPQYHLHIISPVEKQKSGRKLVKRKPRRYNTSANLPRVPWISQWDGRWYGNVWWHVFHCLNWDYGGLKGLKD